MSKLIGFFVIPFLSLSTLVNCSFSASSNPMSEDGFVTIPGGTYSVDCDEQGNGCREIDIEAFEISQYEVTFSDWIKCADNGYCKFNHGSGEITDFSMAVFSASYEEIVTYLEWKNSYKKQSFEYKIPTPDEWSILFHVGKPILDNDPNNSDIEFDSRSVFELLSDQNGIYGLLNDNREWLRDRDYCYLSFPRAYNLSKVKRVNCSTRSDRTAFRVARR